VVPVRAMVLGIAAFACLAVIFTLLLLLVHQLRPKTFKFKAAITKWISVEVELEAPESANHSLPSTYHDRQQTATATAQEHRPDY
jgi:hypothetical protein